MGKQPPVGERVAAVETEVKNVKRSIDALADTVKVGMRELREELQTQSLNGRTERAKALVDDVGDDESRETLREMVRNHDRRAWLARPVLRWIGAGGLVVLGGIVGKLLGA